MLFTGKNYVHFLKINILINNMKSYSVGIGILSLFLIMTVPVYAEVTEFSIEKKLLYN